MRAANTLMFVCAVATLSGCGLRDREPSSDHVARLLPDEMIDIDGTARDYHLYLPDEPETASIVMLLHGNGGSAAQLLGLERTTAPYEVWRDVARRENVILVAPDGIEGPDGKQGWNDCRTDAGTNPTSDDVRFLTMLLDEVRDEYASESAGTYVVGTSNGGAMTQRLADTVPEQLDAVAVIVASRPVNTECDDSSTALPVLFMNGTEDPIAPYDGGQIAGDRGEVMSTPDTVAYWVARNGASVTPTVTMVPDTDTGDGSTIVRNTYDGGSDGAVVEHYEVVGGGHTEPSSDERYGRLFKRIVGQQNGDIEMAEEIWSFFERN